MTAPLDLDRLAKLCGLFSSQYDGEVVAAARRADAMVRASGLTWGDVVVANDAKPPQLDPLGSGVAGEIRFCLLHRHRLAGWEANFVASLRDQSFPATTRQRNVLNSIVGRLRARAEAACMPRDDGKFGEASGKKASPPVLVHRQ